MIDNAIWRNVAYKCWRVCVCVRARCGVCALFANYGHSSSAKSGE